MPNTNQTFELMADYFQIVLRDDTQTRHHSAVAWTDSTVAQMVATAPGTVVFGTARNMPVPVSVAVCDDAPDLSASSFDRINDVILDIESGRMIVMGLMDYEPDAVRIPLPQGRYNVRIGYANLDTISDDGLEGDDSYHVFVWPIHSAQP